MRLLKSFLYRIWAAASKALAVDMAADSRAANDALKNWASGSGRAAIKSSGPRDRTRAKGVVRVARCIAVS